MKSMNRTAPTARKIKRQQKRIQENQLLLDAIIDSMPLAEREQIVDLCLSLRTKENDGTTNK